LRLKGQNHEILVIESLDQRLIGCPTNQRNIPHGNDYSVLGNTFKKAPGGEQRTSRSVGHWLPDRHNGMILRGLDNIFSTMVNNDPDRARRQIRQDFQKQRALSLISTGSRKQRQERFVSRVSQHASPLARSEDNTGSL
jgi:hypothetical protein